MRESSVILQSYVSGLRHLLNGTSATLFVPAPLGGSSQPLLIHDGSDASLPELATPEAAQRFASKAKPGQAKSEAEGFPPFLKGTEAGTLLLALDPAPTSWQPSKPKRRRSDRGTQQLSGRVAWLGLRFPKDDQISWNKRLSEISDTSILWNWVFHLGAALADHTGQTSAILKDPITGLPGRARFQAALSEQFEIAQRDDEPFAVLMINPDDFGAVNERFGRDAGDRTVREIGSRLQAVLRTEDEVSRYGSVIFAAILRGANAETATAVAEKVADHIAEGAFLEGAVRLGFSLGLANYSPRDTTVHDADDLVRRADQALNAAKRHGGGQIADWDERTAVSESGAFDRLSGIFTANQSKDYRNMVLLWDAVSVIASHSESEGLTAEVIGRLYSTFKPDRVALFGIDTENEPFLVHGLTKRLDKSAAQERVETIEITETTRQLVRSAIRAADFREAEFAGESESDEAIHAYAIPLIVSNECVGSLYLDGSTVRLSLDPSDLIFLRALASQIAVALDRSRLSELESKHREQESRRLRSELNDLRHVLQQAKLVYRAPEMERVVVTARRVAPTDATILITGESGTGKELLARTIHELSPRRGRRMVIVDCGAIATSLIESELFGHEKGAYTGAQQRKSGRLAEADGGTVVLDEIAELPLEVQTKLLRFVQEKQFVTVGGTRQQRVDVRILAATNRDLAVEVAAGRFREDLYYRLNVIRLEIPPLRSRPTDILHLAHHFLETYTVQYQKNVNAFTAEAEEAMLRHHWPGNIRELQNRLMQAILLCEEDILSAEDIGLSSAPAQPVPRVAPTSPEWRAGGLFGTHRETEPTSPPVVTESPPFGEAPLEALSGDEILVDLQAAMARQLRAGPEGNRRAVLPFGRWLGEDLVLEAAATANGVARNGAAILGVPETTFRRRLRKAADLVEAGLATRTGTWDEIRVLLGRLTQCTDLQGQDLLELAENALLAEILEQVPNNVRVGSSLLGVTPPTFRRRVTRLAESLAENRDASTEITDSQ